VPTPPRPELGPSDGRLIFDTETLTDLGQGLRVGFYEVRHRDALREEGLLIEPDALASDEHELVVWYVQARGLRLRTRADFVANVFFRIAHARRGQVIGVNLPFDISRIAIGHLVTPARAKSMRGGFTFRLTNDPHRPTVQVKCVNSRAAFVRPTTPKASYVLILQRARRPSISACTSWLSAGGNA